MERKLKSPRQREFVVSSVMAVFSTIKKKPVTDLDSRISALEKRVANLAESMSIEFTNGRLVVKVAGSAEILLTELRRGTDWYEPWDKVDEILLASALVEIRQ